MVHYPPIVDNFGSALSVALLLSILQLWHRDRSTSPSTNPYIGASLSINCSLNSCFDLAAASSCCKNFAWMKMLVDEHMTSAEPAPLKTPRSAINFVFWFELRFLLWLGMCYQVLAAVQLAAPGMRNTHPPRRWSPTTGVEFSTGFSYSSFSLVTGSDGVALTQHQ
jgi:hypothetical protein